LAISFTPNNVIAEIASPFFKTFSFELRHLYVDYSRKNRRGVPQQSQISKSLLKGGPWSDEAADAIDEALSIYKSF